MIPGRTLLRIRRGPGKGFRWRVSSATHGCWLGTYETEKQAAICRFIRPGMTVYDIGAQAGFYTLLFARMVGQRGFVYAFEPCPYENRHLLDHLRINGLANVKVIEAAVADRERLVAMSFDRGMTQNRICDAGELMVPALSLDRCGLPAPDLIKMDIEGAESSALEGSRRLLREQRPIVFVALHSDEQKLKCRNLLADASYQIHDLTGRPIDGVPTADEIYALPRSSA